ncbi:MAG: hypothetical protein QG608_2663 [Actinomycetota bacterium]|nr:hypothetical protein [Actinomycetota bacterium]
MRTLVGVWRFLPTFRDVRDGAVGLVITAVSLVVAARIVDGFSMDGPGPPLAAAGLVGIGDLLARPLLRSTVSRLGAVSALLIGVLWQVLLLWLILDKLPGTHLASVTTVVWTLLVVALVGAISRWVTGHNDSSYLVADLVRRGRRRRAREAREERRARETRDPPQAEQNEQAPQAEQAQQTEQAPQNEQAPQTEQAPQAEQAQQTEQAPQNEQAQQTEQAPQNEQAQQTEQAQQAAQAQQNEHAQQAQQAEQAELTELAREAGRGRDVPPGLVVVQIDGLSYPLLETGVMSGNLGTLARWVRGGSHRATGWWARLPSTTPASQAGLLHGNSEGICAFRWWDRSTGRLMVMSRPRDAALVESQISDGAGLLAAGGVSISNTFSGDADTSLLVVSRAGSRGGLGPGADYLRFFAGPFVFFRALFMAFGEMAKELYQAWQQRARHIEPRVSRHGAFVLLRAISNVLLRDLNVALVAEHMARGAPVIFVDFVDYDEIAHHAGVARPEAMDALAGVDRVLATLEKVADAVERPYRFVVLSDHGQSQGATFRQIHGRSLEDVVRDLCGTGADRTVVSTEEAEAWTPLNTLLSDVLGSSPSTARWRDTRPAGPGAGVVLGPQRPARQDPAAGQVPELVVAGSGNLGLVWFPARCEHVTLEDLHRDHPALVPGLLDHEAIGFVLARSARGPIVVGAAGVRLLQDGTVEGHDPLEPFGPRAAADLARVAAMRTCPDLLVHSRVDPFSGDVHAFEELVGSHGGLGGWQNRAVLVHPADWVIDDDLLDRSVPTDPMLVGAESVHEQLVRWLERSGARLRDLPRRPKECR